MTRRFGKTDWLQLGLQALAADGPEALTIDALCERATRTRGSFYHHFDSMEAYHQALARYWRQDYTDTIIEAVETEAPGFEQQSRLNDLALAIDPRIEQGIRRLAAINGTVADICNEVDARRMRYLASLYARSGRFDAETAEALAGIEYAAFVGFQVITPNVDVEQLQRFHQLFTELIKR